MTSQIPLSRLCRALPRLRPRTASSRTRAERAWRERRHIRRRRQVATPPTPLAEEAESDPPIGG